MKESIKVITEHEDCDITQESSRKRAASKKAVKYSFNDIESALNILDSRLNKYIEKNNKPAEDQLSLFSFDDAAKKNNELNEELRKSKQLCNEQQGEIARLNSRLDLLEQAHKSLKIQNNDLQKRLSNIIGSFDATLGS